MNFRNIAITLLIITLLVIPVSGTTITRTWNQSDPSPALSAAMDENYRTITPDYNNTEPWRSMGRVVIDGQTMVQVKKHYIRTDNITTADGFHWMNFSISDVPATGFTTDPWHIVNGTEVPWVYIGAYEASTWNVTTGYNTGDFGGVPLTTSKLSSVAGMKPTSGQNNSLTLPNFRTLAQNRGTGWELQSFAGVSVIERMYLLEYGTWNSQTAIGPGITQISSGTDNMAMPTGLTGGVGANATNLYNATGQITTVHYSTGQITYPNSYRGIENLYGNLYKWVDGINIKGNNMPWIADHDFASDLFALPYVDTGLTLPAANRYVSNLAYNSSLNWAFLPSAVAGSSSTYLTDNYYQETGNRSALFGGSWGNNTGAGAFRWGLDNAVSTVARHIGARVAFTPPVVSNYTYTNTSANFTFTDESFTISTRTGLASTPTSWNWSFGDGAVSSLQNPTHTFMAGTTNNVNLTVSDGTNYATSIQTITVSGIHSSFTPAGPINTYYPTGTLFTDTSTGSPTSWDWSWGDGTHCYTQDCYHFWWAPGVYNVSLNASTATAFSQNYTVVQVMRPEWP